MNAAFPPGWYQDPTAQGDARYWNGSSWTESVNRGGTTFNAPIDPAQAQLVPVPGTQVSIAPPPTEVQTGGGGSSGGSMMGIILGLLAVVLIGFVIYALVSNDDSDTPTPGTDAPPATAPPATDAPADGG